MAFNPPLGSTSPAVLLDNTKRLDELANGPAAIVPDRAGQPLDPWRQIMAKIDELRQNLSPLSHRYMTLAAAQADITNIPVHAHAFTRPSFFHMASVLSTPSACIRRSSSSTTGLFAELHIVLGAEPVDRFDNLDHVALAELRGTNDEVDAAAVDTPGVFLLALRILHLAYRYGDEVFPLHWLQFFAVPDNLIAQVFQKWPHEAILLIGAAFFARLDNQRRSVIDR